MGLFLLIFCHVGYKITQLNNLVCHQALKQNGGQTREGTIFVPFKGKFCFNIIDFIMHLRMLKSS